jgi:DNA invertase Pin-like site-specific DNA recombinase
MVKIKGVDMAKIRCAIYVRKSSERGLEQEFNSLDNQEQSVKAYIMSQTFQGWEYFKTYSDAAISGGTMARPGLKQMLADIRAGHIQCVLVYKIDRLSRSIYDFKSMMKKDFEPHDCNLVSITQSFDTSNAMGKLTLNMLLSFAEFEREVASERVRDKMRATKAKGMWVGGVPPLGYDVKYGKLTVNESETESLREIFKTYLESTGLTECRLRLINKGIRGKTWTTKRGEFKGGTIIAVSSLQKILKNPIFIGKMPNRSSKEVFDGLHPAILDVETFNRVQKKLADNNTHGDAPYRRGFNLLDNKIQTSNGEKFKNKKGNKGLRQYRYYKIDNITLPAGDIENIVCDEIKKFLNSDMTRLPEEKRLALKQIEFNEPLVKRIVDKIVYANNKLVIFIDVADTEYLVRFRKEEFLNQESAPMGWYLTDDKKQVVIEKEIIISRGACVNHARSSNEVEILTRTENATMFIKALAYGWKYKKRYEVGDSVSRIAKDESRDKRTVYKYLNLAYLVPRIVNDVMVGNIPNGVNLQTLFKIAEGTDDFVSQEKLFYTT